VTRPCHGARPVLLLTQLPHQYTGATPHAIRAREVLDLVERFAPPTSTSTHRPDYKETQVRREFIDPLFVALGWDVDNRRGSRLATRK